MPRDVSEQRNDFAVVADIIGVGARASDLALYTSRGKRFLAVAVSDRARLVVVDVETSRTQSIPLPKELGRIVVREVEIDERKAPVALLWSQYRNSLVTVELGLVGAATTRRYLLSPGSVR